MVGGLQRQMRKGFRGAGYECYPSCSLLNDRKTTGEEKGGREEGRKLTKGRGGGWDKSRRDQGGNHRSHGPGKVFAPYNNVRVVIRTGRRSNRPKKKKCWVVGKKI